MLDILVAAARLSTRTCRELSELGRGLYPSALADRGLAAALSELTERSPIPIKLTVSASNVPTDIAAVAYFVVAEALSNVAKHAQATTVTVTVRVQGPRLLRALAQ